VPLFFYIFSTGINNAAKKIPLGYFAREIAQKKRLVFSGTDRKDKRFSLHKTFSNI
jgi:hypothetical protein